MVGIEFKPGKYGQRAILKSACTSQIIAEIQTRRCLELEVNRARGWRGDDLSFLSCFPWLKSLKIIDFKIRSVEPIHALHELRTLEVITYCGTELRFSAFPELEECALEWRPGAGSIFNRYGLKGLFINNYDGIDLMRFSKLINLESLSILSAPIQTLSGIEKLIELRHIRLANLKKLYKLSGIEFLVKLEELDIHRCKKINRIDEVAALRKLRRLYLNDDADILSLKPLLNLRELESVLFYESTNIVDGDLSPLTRKQRLSTISFKNRRHYTHKREDFGSAYLQSFV